MSDKKQPATRRHLIAASVLLVAAMKSKPTMAFSAPVLCLLGEARIRTPFGERKMSELRIGDLVATHGGHVKPVKWIGRRQVTKVDGEFPAEAVPVLIKKDAFAAGCPSADLYVSAGHALYIDGLLIQAGSLVNGRTIVRSVADDTSVLDYFQIELADHGVVWANGTAVETFLASSDRRLFDNAAEYDALYGAEAECEPAAFAHEISVPGARNQIYSRLRSALVPVVDIRQPFDKVRDRIEDRALELAE